MLRTPFEEIVNVNYVGSTENPIQLNDTFTGDIGLLRKALQEDLPNFKTNQKKVLVIGIDYQYDFISGSLAVNGAKDDVIRFSRFIYNNINKISNIAISLDTHTPHQIFHSCWWIDEFDNFVQPFTQITLKDIDNGKYRAVIAPNESRDYITGLESAGKKKLMIWPYHCIKGTPGAALDTQLSNMLYFFSVAKKSPLKILVKGEDPLTEMYSIFKSEYSKKGIIHLDYLNLFPQYDMIIMGGEAKDYCDLESFLDVVEQYEDMPEVLRKIYLLRDCMSSVDPKNKDVDAEYARLEQQYKINIVDSTDLVI